MWDKIPISSKLIANFASKGLNKFIYNRKEKYFETIAKIFHNSSLQLRDPISFIGRAVSRGGTNVFR